MFRNVVASGKTVRRATPIKINGIPLARGNPRREDFSRLIKPDVDVSDCALRSLARYARRFAVITRK